jgi:hypothetical protein
MPMRPFRWIFAFTIFGLLLGSAHTVLTQEVIPAGANYEGIISTANCTVAGGLCQGDPACNGGAGPNPDNIQAVVELCHNEWTETLSVSGSGTGFRFGKIYISLIYQNGNTATCSRFPNGVPATLANIPLADSDFASMMLGFWVVKPDGSATLKVTKQSPTIYGLKYNSISVREMQPPNVTCYNTNNDPAPQLNALRACGPLKRLGDCNF